MFSAEMFTSPQKHCTGHTILTSCTGSIRVRVRVKIKVRIREAIVILDEAS